MTVRLKIAEATTEVVRQATIWLSINRDNVPTYNNGGGTDAPWWAPIVRCEGPELWTVYVPPLPTHAAMELLSNLDLESTRTTMRESVPA